LSGDDFLSARVRGISFRKTFALHAAVFFYHFEQSYLSSTSPWLLDSTLLFIVFCHQKATKT
jgi:hypothetical protein